MAKDLNKVMLTGYLGADPEMRYTATGSPVTSLRVACGRSYKKEDGTQIDETEWFSVVAWNKLAEVCNQFLNKGSRVYIEGRLQTRSWEKDDGTKAFKTEVIASDMIIISNKDDSAARQKSTDHPRPNAISNDVRAKSAPREMIGDDDLPF